MEFPKISGVSIGASFHKNKLSIKNLKNKIRESQPNLIRVVKCEDDYYSKNAMEKSISYGKYGSFYLDLYKDQIIITDYLGNNYISKLNSLIDSDKNISTKIIKNNIKNIERVYDALIDKDQIFLSYVKKENDCKKIVVSSAKINMSEINYKEIFKSK